MMTDEVSQEERCCENCRNGFVDYAFETNVTACKLLERVWPSFLDPSGDQVESCWSAASATDAGSEE